MGKKCEGVIGLKIDWCLKWLVVCWFKILDQSPHDSGISMLVSIFHAVEYNSSNCSTKQSIEIFIFLKSCACVFFDEKYLCI